MLDYLPYTGCCYEWYSLEVVAQPPTLDPDYWVHPGFACGSERILKSFRINYTSPQFPPECVCVNLLFLCIHDIFVCRISIPYVPSLKQEYWYTLVCIFANSKAAKTGVCCPMIEVIPSQILRFSSPTDFYGLSFLSLLTTYCSGQGIQNGVL